MVDFTLSSSALCDRLRGLSEGLAQKNRYNDAALVNLAIQVIKEQPASRDKDQIITTVVAALRSGAFDQECRAVFDRISRPRGQA